MMHRFLTYFLLGYLFIDIIITDSHNSQLNKLILTLNKTVEYICNHVSDLSLDMALGLTFTEVNLQSIILHNNTDAIKNELWSIMKKCNQCRREITFTNISKNFIINTLLSELMNPNIWIARTSWKKIGTCLSDYSMKSYERTKHEILHSLYKGYPQENQSDYCLTELSLIPTYFCKGSYKCQQMLNQNDECYGYPLLHRILYILSQMNKVECRLKYEATYNKLLENYCKRIYQSILDIIKVHLYDELKDFVMESNLLCGMAGFIDLIDINFINSIINWQNPNGCYSEDFSVNEIAEKISDLDIHCDGHTTAVAVATLALSINFLTENEL